MFNFSKKNTIPHTIKNETIDSLLKFSLIIFLPALVASIIRSQFTGWIHVYTLQIFIFACIVLLYLFRRKCSVPLKVIVFQVSIYLTATTGLHALGYLSSAKIFYILIPLFFWFFVKRKIAIIAAIICIATYTLYAYLFVNEYIHIAFDPDDYIGRGASWTTSGFVMLSIAIFCILLFSKLIEAQHKAFLLVKESEEKHRFLTDNIEDIIWKMDVESKRYTYISPSIEKVRGYLPEELMNADLRTFMPPHSAKIVDEIVQKRLFDFKVHGKAENFITEIEVFHKKGHLLWTEINSHYRLNTETNKIEIIGTSRDITDRKKTQLALEKSEERYKLAIAASNLGIWDWYTASEEVYYSRMWKWQIGYEPHELEPKFSVWTDHLHPDEREEKLTKLQTYLGNPVGQFVMEFRFRHKMGHYIWIHSRAETILDPNGKVIRMYGTHLDITNLKLHEIGLLEKNTLLEKTNAELDNFVYRISHDIRAPLSSCFGILDIMEREDILDEKTDVYFKLLKDVLTRQELVIKNILDYSRNSRGELILEKILLKEMIKLTYIDLEYMEKGKKKVTLILNMDDAFTFTSDKNRIQFIINNLLSNGIKYADEKKDNPTIEISADHRDNSTFIEVKDNGIGITQDVLPHIFEMFYRGNLQSTGSGLGLYIVKETVEKLKGNIQVKSELGSTTFSLILPDLNNNINP